MVQFYIPTTICDIPEPVCGARGQFRVFYLDGHVRDFFGRIGSISLLRESLVARVSRDASIGSVWLYLPSGRLLLCCDKF